MSDHDKAKHLLRVQLCAEERIRNSGEAWKEYDAAVVSAERARLVGLTSEQVVEEAAKAIRESDLVAYGIDDEPVSWVESTERSREDYRRVVRAALPVLLPFLLHRLSPLDFSRDELRRASQADVGGVILGYMEKKVSGLEATIRKDEETMGAYRRVNVEQTERADAAESRVAQLTKDLAKYGEHRAGCELTYSPTNTVCTCGFVSSLQGGSDQ